MALYDKLLAVAPSPVIALNREVARAEVDGPEVALAAVDALDLERYGPFHVSRADLLSRLDRTGEAIDALDAALALTTNASERRFLELSRRSLRDGES